MAAFSPPLQGFPPISVLFSAPWIKSDAVTATMLCPPRAPPPSLFLHLVIPTKPPSFSDWWECIWISYVYTELTLHCCLPPARDLTADIIMPQICANKAVTSLSFRNLPHFELFLLFFFYPHLSFASFFLFVCQITAPPVPTWKEAPLTMLYMCAKLGQCGAIRGNVKQLRMSAYVTLTVTQSTSRRSKQWNNILVHGCQNRGPRVCLFLPFAVGFGCLVCFLQPKSRRGKVICPVLILTLQVSRRIALCTCSLCEDLCQKAVVWSHWKWL